MECIPIEQDRAHPACAGRCNRASAPRTSYDAGEFSRGLEVAGAALRQARELEYRPVLAEALASFGRLQAAGTLFRDAQLTLEEAVLVAAQAGDDRTAAAAWTWLIYTLGLQNRLDEAFALELTARAAVERAHDQVARGWLLNNLGVLHGMRGDAERGGEQLRLALEVKQRILGPEHIDVGISRARRLVPRTHPPAAVSNPA